jgi:hypothetical protein
MCTVSVFKGEDGIILTHSRDEQITREVASPPQWRKYRGKSMLYPKDGKAVGSWIAGHSNAIVGLLNGAFEPHLRRIPYAKSRGLVLLDALIYPSISDYIHNSNFAQIEPFTLVYADLSGTVSILRWDGEIKHFSENLPLPLMLCSSTIYNSIEQENRQQLFAKFTASLTSLDSNAIFDFHKTQKFNLESLPTQLTLEENLKTLSVTQLHLKNKKIKFRHTEII